MAPELMALHYLMHPKLIILAVGGAFDAAMTAAAATGVSGNPLAVALVGAVGLIIATAIPVIVQTFRRPPDSIATLIEAQEEMRAEIDRLERLLWKHGIDPSEADNAADP